VLLHGLISFVYNTVIVALTINTLAGLRNWFFYEPGRSISWHSADWRIASHTCTEGTAVGTAKPVWLQTHVPVCKRVLWIIVLKHTTEHSKTLLNSR
jgi:hypothetical protein